MEFVLTTDLITELVFSIDKDPAEPHKFVLTFFHRYSFEADSDEQVNPDTSSDRVVWAEKSARYDLKFFFLRSR